LDMLVRSKQAWSNISNILGDLTRDRPTRVKLVYPCRDG
jgi:hypothetical protein